MRRSTNCRKRHSSIVSAFGEDSPRTAKERTKTPTRGQGVVVMMLPAAFLGLVLSPRPPLTLRSTSAAALAQPTAVRGAAIYLSENDKKPDAKSQQQRWQNLTASAASKPGRDDSSLGPSMKGVVSKTKPTKEAASRRANPRASTSASKPLNASKDYAQEFMAKPTYQSPPIDDGLRRRAPGLTNNFAEVPMSAFKTPFGMPVPKGSSLDDPYAAQYDSGRPFFAGGLPGRRMPGGGVWDSHRFQTSGMGSVRPESADSPDGVPYSSSRGRDDDDRWGSAQRDASRDPSASASQMSAAALNDALNNAKAKFSGAFSGPSQPANNQRFMSEASASASEASAAALGTALNEAKGRERVLESLLFEIADEFREGARASSDRSRMTILQASDEDIERISRLAELVPELTKANAALRAADDAVVAARQRDEQVLELIELAEEAQKAYEVAYANVEDAKESVEKIQDLRMLPESARPHMQTALVECKQLLLEAQDELRAATAEKQRYDRQLNDLTRQVGQMGQMGQMGQRRR